jgi:hypothetical protein
MAEQFPLKIIFMLKLFHMSFKAFLSKLNQKNTALLPPVKPLLKTITLALLVSFTIFAIKPVRAAGGWTKFAEETLGLNVTNWGKKVGDNTLYWIGGLIAGEKEMAALENQMENPPVDGAQNGGFLPGGALGTTHNLIAQTYIMPVSGVEYIASLKNNFLGKPAYAQGYGYDSLQPLIKIWKGFRNITYILFSLFFIIIGLMIMFRVKTSPQTVISIQNAVPKIFTTLILITFSYAIAGLLIDLMNLLQGLVLSLLFTVQGKELENNLLIGGGGGNFSGFAHPTLNDIFTLAKRALPLNTIGILGVVVGGVLGAFFPGIGIIIGGGAGGVIVLLTILIVLLIWQLKFFFGLITTYVNILLKIILAPFEIAFGALPASKIGFSSWLNQLVGNLAVFPISFLFLVLVNVIIDSINNNPLARGGSVWMPSIMNPGGNLVDWATGPSGGLPAAAIGFAAVFLLSKLPQMIPEFIFMIKPSPWGTAIGETSKAFSIGAISNKIGSISGGVRDISDTMKVGRDWKKIITGKSTGTNQATASPNYQPATGKTGRTGGTGPISPPPNP